MSSIKTQIKLVDETSSTLNKISSNLNKTSSAFNKIKSSALASNSSMRGFTSAIRGAGTEASGAGSKISNTTQSMGSMYKRVVALAASYLTLRTAINGAKKSLELWNTQEQAELKLGNTLTNQGASGSVLNTMKAFASDQQSKGVIGDETQLAGINKLAMATTNVDALKKLTVAMNDYAANANGLENNESTLASAGSVLMKAMNGTTTMLARQGYTITDAQANMLKYGDEMQRAATVAEIVENKVGGMNSKLAQTSGGKVKQLSNAWGDLEESIGQSLTPIVEQLVDFVQANMPIITGLVDGFMNALTSGLQWLINNGEMVWNIVQAVTLIAAACSGTLSLVVAVTGLSAVNELKNGIQDATDGVTDMTTKSQLASLETQLFFQKVQRLVHQVGDAFNVVFTWIGSGFKTLAQEFMEPFQKIFTMISGFINGKSISEIESDIASVGQTSDNLKTQYAKEITDSLRQKDLDWSSDSRDINETQNQITSLKATGGSKSNNKNKSKSTESVKDDTVKSPVKTIATTTAKIAKSLDITSENVKYIRDIASQRSINRYTNSNIKINMTNNNSIASGNDVDGIVNSLVTKLQSELDANGEGVFA